MRRIDDEKVGMAREIIAGRRGFSPESLCLLANALLEKNDFGHARRIYAIALSLRPDAALAADAEIKLALATYKDPDLPLDDRLKKAEACLLGLLARRGPSNPQRRQEVFGILGSIHKRRWRAYGHLEDLEKALRHYRAGYQMGIAADLGYTAINTAFVLDLLSAVARNPDGSPSAAALALRQESAAVRAQVVAALTQADQAVPKAHFDCTLGEAYLGLRQYSEASVFMRRAAARQPDNWRLESTARQIAHIVRLQAAGDGIPVERLAELLDSPCCTTFSAAARRPPQHSSSAKSVWLFRAAVSGLPLPHRRLRRLAELDMLRHVEVLSCVSGGSLSARIIYLELRRLIQTKPDGQITRADYVSVVHNVQTGFLAGVRQRYPYAHVPRTPGSNWKALASRRLHHYRPPGGSL